VQRRLNRSRCRLGCGLTWAESITCYMRGPDPAWEGEILVDRRPLQSIGTFCRSCAKTAKPIHLPFSKLVRIRFEAGSKLVADPGSKLVADLQRAEIWPIIYLASSELARASRSATKFITLSGSKLVRSWFEAGRRPASNLSATSFEPDSVMEFSFEPVCDQLQTSFKPASVMEFGFYTVAQIAKRFEPSTVLLACHTIQPSNCACAVFIWIMRHELSKFVYLLESPAVSRC